MSPDSLVIFLKTSQRPQPETHQQMLELYHKIEQGEKWSLTPKNANALEDPALQMAELEKFVPHGNLVSSFSGTDIHAYKMGKWTTDALIPWDYHRERSDHLTNE
jgi:hypothetical protein